MKDPCPADNPGIRCGKKAEHRTKGGQYNESGTVDFILQ